MLTIALFATLALGQATSERDAADAAEGDVERQRQAEVTLLAPAKARLLEITIGNAEESAKLYDKPLLRWSNPTAGSVHGEVFLWTRQKRPVAIASIFRWYHPFTDANIEIVSLSESPLEAQEQKQTIWQSKEAGVSWHTMPGKERNPGSAAGRLSQMRALAKRFSARLLDQRGGDEVTRDLRLLQQPVYRYASPEAGIADGGLFALVEVTDPEAWLLLEATVDDQAIEWRYAVARMNADALEMRLDGRPIMQWNKIQQAWKQREAPYTFFNFDPARVPLPSTAVSKP
jgi:hypothetical protein